MYPIGYDDTEDKSYVLFASLDPVVGDDSLELSYRIVEHDGATDSEYSYWSGKDTAALIPKKEDRTSILAMSAVALNLLLNSAKPAKVFFCSRDAYPPESANEKFILLAHVFENCGYSVSTADPYHGLQCWWMERKTIDPI